MTNKKMQDYINSIDKKMNFYDAAIKNMSLNLYIVSEALKKHMNKSDKEFKEFMDGLLKEYSEKLKKMNEDKQQQKPNIEVTDA